MMIKNKKTKKTKKTNLIFFLFFKIKIWLCIFKLKMLMFSKMELWFLKKILLMLVELKFGITKKNKNIN